MAGPLLVVAAYAPPGWSDPQVTDSKDLDDAARREIYSRYYHDPAFVFAPVLVAVEAIDRMTPAQALPWAHRKAIADCATMLKKLTSVTPVIAVDGSMNIGGVDGFDEILYVPQGDGKVPEISLASCIAKVMRDALMRKAGIAFPGYGFENHFGYVTPEHEAALRQLGPCPLHRTTYAPVAKIIAERNKSEQLQEAWGFDEDE